MTSRGKKDLFRVLYKAKTIKGKIDKCDFNKLRISVH